MTEIRLKIQCVEDKDHAKILRMKTVPRETVEILGELMCGTSDRYIFKPGALSPIGMCALCRGRLTYEIEERAPREAA